MASSILRRTFTTQANLKIGLIPADGIGREGKKGKLLKKKSFTYFC